MMISKKLKRRSFFLLGIMLLGAYLVVFQLAPYIILHPRKVDEAVLTKFFGEVPMPKEKEQIAELVTIPTSGGLNLSAWIIQPKNQPAKGTLIFVHGIGGSKEFSIPAAERIVGLGLNVVVFDLRAHGKSDGTYCTYGFYEKQDVSALIDFLEQRNLTGPIGLHGSSLGGAIALQAASVEDRIDFLIVESTFATLEEVTFEYMDRISPVSSKWVAQLALSQAGRKANFDPDEVKPEQAAAKIEIPVFMAHGTKDVHIPIAHGKRNFDQLKSSEKVWRKVDGAEHNSVVQKGGQPYQNEMNAFILRQLPPHSD